MTIYINAATAYFAEKLGQRTSNMLGQSQTLPYYNAFAESLLSLAQLYAYFDEQIDRTLAQAGWSASELSQIPILLGSTAYVISDCESRLAQGVPLPQEYSLAVIADHLRQRYQTQVFSFATSCTSSAQAIGYGAKMLQAGIAQKALIIGFEMFNRLTFEHFHAMHLLATQAPYLPLLNPQGIVLGEGIGCVALSKEQNASLPCEIFGITCQTDNDNLTNSSETALRALLTECLAKAGLSAEQIMAIKIHGVGGKSDEMEQAVLQSICPQAELILTKPYLGHTLGASGALETAWLWQALQTQTLPTLPWQIATEIPPLAHGKAIKCGYILNYFLGFGGSHIAWILKVGNNQ